MDALPTPTVASPLLFGAPAPPGDLLPWALAQQRLAAARNYWIATTRPDGRPHCRPVWGVWLPDGFWFSTGSLARRNLAANPQITMHLESGEEVLIVEAVAAAVTGAEKLQPFLTAYNAKYEWDLFATDDGVADSAGAAGPAYRVQPRVVFGWDAGMRAPTRWSFLDSVTPPCRRFDFLPSPHGRSPTGNRISSTLYAEVVRMTRV
jgi:hypothetical protein